MADPHPPNLPRDRARTGRDPAAGTGRGAERGAGRDAERGAGGTAALRDAARTWRDDDPDPATRAEIDALLAAGDDAALADRFGRRLEFGTAGLRGALGAGPNRMNRALVRRATAGLASWVRAGGGRTVVVGRDARHGSADFAADAAAVLAGAGLRPLAFEGVVPTPLLAFAVRHLGADAGVMVTASHNPPADNGYKVYAGDGAQIVPPMDGRISAAIDAVPSVASIPLGAPGDVAPVGDDVAAAYVAATTALSVTDRRDVRIAYTPLHGVGRPLFERVLAEAGFPPPLVVPEQAEPDPDFPTVPFPNPEEPGAMDRVIALAAAEGADVAIAHDPDADRLAVALPDPATGRWRALTGDEIGALLGDWRLERDGTGPDRLVATTIVSSSLLGKLAAEHGVQYVETLTGFKWLARAALARPSLRFVYAYEEALGSCVGGIVLDKDGIGAGMAFAELVAATEGSVFARLDAVHARHGVHRTAQRSVRYDGPDAPDRSRAVVDRLVDDPPAALGGRPVTAVDDLRDGFGDLPPADAVRLHLDGARVVVRPSGTEPKLKSYIEVVAPTAAEADAALDALAADVRSIL